jgi:multiple sugar transport system ATP-binding protein
MASVLVDNLSKSFLSPTRGEIRAVDRVSLAVESGELLVLVGPSGSGKTTLLRLIAGLEAPSGGSIRIDGQRVDRKPPEARDVAMVFQEHSLYPHMTIHRNLAFGLMLRKFGKAEIENRVREAADLLGLTALLDRFPMNLSGGERQRVAVGRAMVLRPKVFLLDEPLSNLDAPLRARMRRDIADLHRRLGATMIYVTHDQVEAMTLADRMAVIKSGALQQVGRPGEVYDCPANTFVAGFIGAPPMNIFNGVLARQGPSVWFRGEAGAGGVPVAFELDEATRTVLADHCGEKVLLGLRPEDIRPLSSAEKSAPSEVLMEVTVTAIEPLGWEMHLYGNASGWSLVARVASNCQAKIGQDIRLALAISKARWFGAKSGQRLR